MQSGAPPPRRLGAFAILVLLVLPLQARSQSGALSGSVRALGSDLPVPQARVEIQGSGTFGTRTVATGSDGSFRSEVPAGAYVVVVSADGFEALRLPPVQVRPGQSTTLTVVITPVAFILNPLVVSASRREERAARAPAAVSTVRRAEIDAQPAFTAVEHIATLPGIDAPRTGLMQSAAVARGFNDVFSTALLVLTDHRYANVPSNRLNAHYMIPVNDLDVDRIEVSLGPGAALYGPNATDGVMHILTRSPIDDPGTSVTLSGGERDTFQGAFRTAFAPSPQLGFKLSGQWFRGDGWPWIDPAEEAARAQNPDNPLIGARGFLAERWSADARLDVRPDEGTEWVTSAGFNRTVDNVELSGAGRSHELDYDYSYVQTRVRRGGLFAQAFANFSDAGNSHFFRTGERVVDRSRIYAAQVQHDLDVTDAVGLTWGVDLLRTDTRTEGTITGRWEDDDLVNEVGGYLQAAATLSERVELVGALRVDHHNRLEDPVFSPRAALVFTPAEGHTLRATFNRGFLTPPTLGLFLDLLAGSIPIFPGFGYDIRTVGVPESGYHFTSCEGGYQSQCMRVPGSAQLIPANATLLWDQLIAGLAPALSGLLPNPGSAVGTVFRRLSLTDAANPFPIDPVGPRDIARLRPTVTNTFEVGYTGLQAGRLLLTANAYYSKRRDFVGPISVETPNVFFDPVTTAAYVNQQLGPLVGQGLTQADIDALVAGLAAIPLGTVSPAEWDSQDILLTFRNFGDVDLWGFEVAGKLLATDRLSFDGSVSFVSEDCFDTDHNGSCFDPFDRALNAPRWKGAFAGRYRNATTGVFGEARLRLSDGFPMSSGVFMGNVAAYGVVDATLGTDIPGVTGASVQLAVTNLLGRRHREVIGAPELGRLAVLRLRYDF